MVPPSRLIYKKIGLPIHQKYRFIGYKTSILRHLIDCGDEVVNGDSHAQFTIQVKIADVAKTATEHYTGAIQSAALGVAGEAVTAINTMNTVLDGVSVAGMVGDLMPEGKKPELKRPGAVAYKKDHIMNGRIIVTLGMQGGETPGWIDTGKHEITLRDVAVILNAH